MEFASFDEFWKALGRLYDSTLQNAEEIRELGASIQELNRGTERHLNAVERHQQVIETHERRFDRSEITVEAILEDLRRHRGGHSPQ